MKADRVPIYDYGTIQNALLMGSNPPPIPGWITLKVVWRGGATSIPIHNTDPTKGIFAGTLADCTAQMEWTAEVGHLSFQSVPLETSQSSYAQIGQETNGSYLTPS